VRNAYPTVQNVIKVSSFSVSVDYPFSAAIWQTSEEEKDFNGDLGRTGMELIAVSVRKHLPQVKKLSP
jgi:hypothetical protein